jgi:hypothetical protein
VPVQVPANPVMELLHTLDHGIGLDTVQKSERVTITAGCTTVEDFFYVEMENLIDCLTNNTLIIAKTHLKKLIKWAEE